MHRAADIVLGVLAAVRTMRVARVSTFRHSNPACPQCSRILTEHERQFKGAFTVIRNAASAHAMRLCEGNDTTRVLAAPTERGRLLGTTPIEESEIVGN